MKGGRPEPVPGKAEGVSRRALLGAALLPLILSEAEPSKPVLSLSKGLVSKDAPAKWDRALAALRAAEAALTAAEKGPEAVYDRLGARFSLP